MSGRKTWPQGPGELRQRNRLGHAGGRPL